MTKMIDNTKTFLDERLHLKEGVCAIKWKFLFFLKITLALISWNSASLFSWNLNCFSHSCWATLDLSDRFATARKDSCPLTAAHNYSPPDISNIVISKYPLISKNIVWTLLFLFTFQLLLSRTTDISK